MGEVLVRLLSLLLAAAFAGGSLQAEPITIASWNIANLHHEEGFHLRAFSETYHSVERRSVDFDLLEAYRDKLAMGGKPADVIALQEIGTKAALERLFPNDLYETRISPRWTSDDIAEGEGEIFTAIAVRRAAGIGIVGTDDIPEMSILHSDGRPTRAGTGVLLEVGGERFWFLSVHMKSSCRNTKAVDRSIQDDCETLWRQVPSLGEWIADKRVAGTPFVIAGDFNREFRRYGVEDPIWKALNGIDPDGAIDTPQMVKFPVSEQSACPTGRGKSGQPIHWFLIDERLAGQVVPGSYFETRYSEDHIEMTRNGRGLSDHCPISIQVDLN